MDKHKNKHSHFSQTI